MKYMLLIYDNPDTREAFFGADGDALVGEVDALMEELRESGELVGGAAVADPSNTQTMRVRDGAVAMTDGPFAEAKEHLGGYLLVDCESAERAVEIASRWLNTRFCAMEVRLVKESDMPTAQTPIKVLPRGEHSDGRLAVIDEHIPADFDGPPLHVHPSFDEVFTSSRESSRSGSGTSSPRSDPDNSPSGRAAKRTPSPTSAEPTPACSCRHPRRLRALLPPARRRARRRRATPRAGRSAALHRDRRASDPPHVHGSGIPGATMTSFQPELWVDRAGAAVAFYKAAFGASVLHCVGEGDDIVAQLGVGDAAFWVTSAAPSMNRFSPKEIGGATSRTLLVADDPDAVLERAVGAGATETSPVTDEHGWRLGRIVDPFGHEWEIGKPIAAWPPT